MEFRVEFVSKAVGLFKLVGAVKWQIFNRQLFHYVSWEGKWGEEVWLVTASDLVSLFRKETLSLEKPTKRYYLP